MRTNHPWASRKQYMLYSFQSLLSFRATYTLVILPTSLWVWEERLCATFIYGLPYTFITNSFLRYVGEERETNTRWEFSMSGSVYINYLILIRTPWGRWINTCFNICLGESNSPKVQQLLEVKLRFNLQWLQFCLILNLLFFPLLPSSQWTSLRPFRKQFMLTATLWGRFLLS